MKDAPALRSLTHSQNAGFLCTQQWQNPRFSVEYKPVAMVSGAGSKSAVPRWRGDNPKIYSAVVDYCH
jgi:hypothetical protein